MFPKVKAAGDVNCAVSNQRSIVCPLESLALTPVVFGVWPPPI